MQTVNANGESNDNGGRQMIEKRRSLPCIITVIEPGAQLYEGGNVTILFPFCSLFLIVHSFQLTTWRGNQ